MKYMVITKILNSGRAIITKPEKAVVSESFSTEGKDYDYYCDVFDSEEEANKFYSEYKSL